MGCTSPTWPSSSPFITAIPQSYFVALPNDSRSTKSEADDVLAALGQRHAHSVDIVTSNYHTRRAGNIYRAKAPGLEIHMIAAPDVYFTPDGWWKNRDARKDFSDGMDEDRGNLVRNVILA